MKNKTHSQLAYAIRAIKKQLRDDNKLWVDTSRNITDKDEREKILSDIKGRCAYLSDAIRNFKRSIKNSQRESNPNPPKYVYLLMRTHINENCVPLYNWVECASSSRYKIQQRANAINKDRKQTILSKYGVRDDVFNESLLMADSIMHEKYFFGDDGTYSNAYIKVLSEILSVSPEKCSEIIKFSDRPLEKKVEIIKVEII